MLVEQATDFLRNAFQCIVQFIAELGIPIDFA
jgi:hypothetical protein